MLSMTIMKRLALIAGVTGCGLSSGAWAFPTYASGEGIWGASVLSSQERQQYVRNIQGMKSYPECQAYLEAHRKEVQERARVQNVNLPPPPSRSPCDVMQTMGRFGSNPVYVPSYEPTAK
jgi:hypothetical protein